MPRHEEVKEAFTEDKSVPDLMKELGLCRTTVASALKRHGLTPRPARRGRIRGGINKNFNHPAALRTLSIAYEVLSNPDASYASVGKKHNLTRERVRQIRAAALQAGFTEHGK